MVRVGYSHAATADRVCGEVLTCCDNELGMWRRPHMLGQQIGYMVKSSYAVAFVELVVTSNGYVTWHILVASYCNML